MRHILFPNHLPAYGGIVYNDVDKVNGRPNMLNIWAKSKDNSSEF